MIVNAKHLFANIKLFRTWLEQNSPSENDDYKRHIVDILKEWLDEKMPRQGVGNLFRFDNAQEYNSIKDRIITTPSFNTINDNDGSGRPHAALNHYSKYLADFAMGELKQKLEEKYPSDGRRILGGTFRKK